jgi:hypothetical protein
MAEYERFFLMTRDVLNDAIEARALPREVKAPLHQMSRDVIGQLTSTEAIAIFNSAAREAGEDIDRLLDLEIGFLLSKRAYGQERVGDLPADPVRDHDKRLEDCKTV